MDDVAVDRWLAMTGRWSELARDVVRDMFDRTSDLGMLSPGAGELELTPTIA
jgi:hypothetical protein